ncbi:protein atonal homolog 1-like [Pollicipes pollicipes]|uniref:protein atonal homolog 1-like n=1 Tax=Pollicipes pollicipes TaxID=41117 RepID=UPI00188532ED|nr:protein atonal homolog 1-like [Pollicipes pollicipes]
MTTSEEGARRAAAGPYSLRARSLRRRLEQERGGGQPHHRPPEPSTRPPPLSKYRRKTANARERDRMKNINSAFEMLERSIPSLLLGGGEKLTKVTLLRAAVQYIQALAALLERGQSADDEPTQRPPPPPASVMLLEAVPDAADPLDGLDDLTDFQLPDGFDALLADHDEGVSVDDSDFRDLAIP